MRPLRALLAHLLTWKGRGSWAIVQPATRGHLDVLTSHLTSFRVRRLYNRLREEQEETVNENQTCGRRGSFSSRASVKWRRGLEGTRRWFTGQKFPFTSKALGFERNPFIKRNGAPACRPFQSSSQKQPVTLRVCSQNSESEAVCRVFLPSLKPHRETVFKISNLQMETKTKTSFLIIWSLIRSPWRWSGAIFKQAQRGRRTACENTLGFKGPGVKNTRPFLCKRHFQHDTQRCRWTNESTKQVCRTQSLQKDQNPIDKLPVETQFPALVKLKTDKMLQETTWLNTFMRINSMNELYYGLWKLGNGSYSNM